MPARARMIDHPRTGEKTTYAALADEFGLTVSTVKNRYHEGKRGDRLIEPSDYGEERRSRAMGIRWRNEKDDPSFRDDLVRFLSSQTGKLSTHLFRDFARF